MTVKSNVEGLYVLSRRGHERARGKLNYVVGELSFSGEDTRGAVRRTLTLLVRGESHRDADAAGPFVVRRVE